MDNNNVRCLLCKQTPDIAFGEFITSDNYQFHYLCLLLSPALYQKASEANGLYGFVLKDVVSEQHRINKQKCSYCKENHANFSCVIAKCRRSFHVWCGLENDCQYRMTDFRTFCHEHRTFEQPKVHAKQEECVICSESMETFRCNKSIYADCCKESWYHQNCLTQMADTAGYFFRCPLCKNEEKFREQVMQQGIFVPERDAAWELEPNAFAEQLERPNRCNAKRCCCSRGRKYAPKEGTVWNMIFCQACGGNGVHEGCLDDMPYYICDLCAQMGANSLLDDCLEISQDSNKPHEKNDPDIQSMPSCTVSLRDIGEIHLVSDSRAKKYFSGKWINFCRLKDFTNKKTEPLVTKPLLIQSPPQITTKTSPSKIIRVQYFTDDEGPIRSPITVSNYRNKRPLDQELNPHENPSKILKISESFEDISHLIPSSPALNTNKTQQNSFQQGNTSHESMSSDAENRTPPLLTKFDSWNSHEYRSPKKEIKSIPFKESKRGFFKQMTLDSFFCRNNSNNI